MSYHPSASATVGGPAPLRSLGGGVEKEITVGPKRGRPLPAELFTMPPLLRAPG